MSPFWNTKRFVNLHRSVHAERQTNTNSQHSTTVSNTQGFIRSIKWLISMTDQRPFSPIPKTLSISTSVHVQMTATVNYWKSTKKTKNNKTVDRVLSPYPVRRGDSGRSLTACPASCSAGPVHKEQWFVYWRLIAPPTAQGHLRAFTKHAHLYINIKHINTNIIQKLVPSVLLS